MDCIVDELVYQNYRTNRQNPPGMSPSQLAQVFGPLSEWLEKRYQLEADPHGIGDAMSCEAQRRYESGIVEEARAIVAGRSTLNITVEHLRVVLSWLDGCNIAGAEGLEGTEPPF
jgi:hypothetical protein